MPTLSVFQLYYDEQVIKYVSHHTNNVSDLNLIKINCFLYLYYSKKFGNMRLHLQNFFFN
jgi:hypothetical protein